MDNTHKPGHTVLIIDDEPANLKVIENHLAARGIEVLIARHGEEGIEKAKYARPALILLDVLMPGIDGFETCRRLKSDETTQDIPVIFETIMDSLEDMVKGFEVGGVDYITKPFQQKEVLARVTTHLRIRNLTRRLEEAKESLERRVEERTAELARANQDLQLEIAVRKLAEEELKKHREHLEELVKVRTAELTSAKEQAEAANAFKSDFLARMSHEIRTPLNVVTGLTSIVLKSELSAEQSDYLKKIQTASNNLLTVINDILDFSKIEADRIELANEPFDLDRLLEQLADLFSYRVAQKDINLIFAVAPQVPRQLAGDPARLTQVLVNLVDNAIKFTEKGEIVVGVELVDAAEKMRGQVALEYRFSDTGIGIAADALPTLFEPFTQAESYLTREHEGTGLGLAICQRLVKLMGGRIWVESTLGKGSTFFFTVLLEARAQKKHPIRLPQDLHGLKTMVVDNSATGRRVLSGLLESFAFNVTAVGSGEKAIEMLRHNAAGEPYQLVLLDWKLPDTDGIEVATAIRGNPDLQFTPIIIMFNGYDHKLVQTHMDMTAVGTYLIKPVKPSQLFNTIINLFSRADAVIPRIETKETAQLDLIAGRRVLVVEDSDLNRIVAVALLTEQGLNAEIATDGRMAVNMVTRAATGYYDAVLMDIQMPIIDGYEATRKIRKLEKERATVCGQPQIRIPIIALTAHAMKGEKVKCLAADMDDYLAKPIDAHQLERVLRKWICIR